MLSPIYNLVSPIFTYVLLMCFLKNKLPKIICGKIRAFSVMSNSVASWTAASQAFLSMGFSRQEYWNALPFPPPEDPPDPGIEPAPPVAPSLAGAFYHWATRETSILKSRDITLPTKVRTVKAIFFSSSHIGMWESDHKEGWVPKSWCFWICGAREDSWEFLGLQEDPTNPSERKSVLN